MKLLQTTDCVGGVWTYALTLADALAPHGVEVVLATTGPPPSGDQRARAAGRANVTLVESTYRLEWQDDPWADVAAAGDWLLRLEREHRPDVVHLNGYAHAALPWDAPTVVVAHSDVRSWFRAVEGTDAPASFDRYGDAVRDGLDAVSAVVAPTAAVLADLRREYGGGGEAGGWADRATVIANAANPDDFPPPASPSARRDVVMTAGRVWDRAKNLPALASVARDLPWPVEVAGDAAGPDGRVPNVPGVGDVVMLGRLSPPDLVAKLAAASIYALPAKYEPFGLSALEAALAGCALVLGDIPSLREVWGETALFVPPGDPSRLRDAIELLIEQPSQRAALAAAAHGRARTYSPARLGTAYLALYRSLLAPTAPA